MDFLKPYIRSFMISDFKSGLNAAQPRLLINSKFLEDTVSEVTAQDWVAHFRARDHEVHDRRQLGSLSVLDDEHLPTLAKNDLQQKTSQLVKALRVSQSTVIEHQRALGFVSKQSEWVPKQLTEVSRQRGVEVAVSLL